MDRPALPGTSHSEASRSETSRSSLSFLERRLSRLTFSRAVSAVTQDSRGPLGLNLLHAPSETHVDIVFIHGLRGGSRKTWCGSEEPALFWPKEWLPTEPGFKNVRIHSYGYNADWAEKRGNTLNAHDFGQGLVADLNNSPEIRASGTTPILLVGHSMGGLVIKKAYLLATRDPSCASLASRIHSVFFLATPHRGADSAQLLSNVLSAVTIGEKAYVQDLIPSSGLLQGINDEFRHVCQNVGLWSFYETKATNLGYTYSLVVSKDSAVMNLPGERTQPLTADHRHICKFDSPRDSNYVAIRNALLAVVETIEQESFSSRRETNRVQMKLIGRHISAPERPEADLANLSDNQIDGTCLWLTGKSTFQDWQAGEDEENADVPKTFWLSGKPGTGKSIAAAHVIRYLESCNADCSCYFFKHNNKEGSSVAALLRSMAYQMAETNYDVRNELLSMVNDADYFSKDDEKSVWRSLFLKRILHVELHQPHYWVIDGLDESTNHTALINLLPKIDKATPLRIFIVSRPLPAVERLFGTNKIAATVETIPVEHSLQDIRLFLEANAAFLPVDDEEARTDLIDRIIKKSNGSFLWASLVLKELEVTHSAQQIHEVLDQIPSEMDHLYRRILDGIRAVPRNQALAKAIFRWTVCAVRPLAVDELKKALMLDIGHIVPRLDMVVGSITGYLVDVGSDGQVQLVHETVKSFLTQQNLDSEFAVDRRKEHSRITEVCIRYLCGEEFEVPKARRISVSAHSDRSTFALYAANHFSAHIAESSSAIDSPLVLLDTFFLTSVLSWIEYIARSGNLGTLLQTSKNLKTYLDRREKYRSPLGKEVQRVRAWTDDLIRLVAAFGRNLISFPGAIHFLIPPLCPRNSMIHKVLKDHARSLEVVGFHDQDWDDRISCTVYPEGQALSVATTETRYAVGLSTGKIFIYKNTTLEEVHALDQAQAVRHLLFSSSGAMLASCGLSKLALWDSQTGVQLWAVPINGLVFAIAFDRDDATVKLATRDNQIMSFESQAGDRLDDSAFFDMNENEPETGIYRRPPTHVCFCSEHDLLAVAYRQRPINFWDLEDNSWLSHFYKGDPNVYPGPLLVGLTINPNPELELAAASYQDGDLVVFNPFDGQQHAIVETSAQCLVSSPDGRILATGDGNGMIQLFNFENLRLLYRVSMYDFDIRAMVFAPDNLRFFDLRSNHCNVWEPTVLVRKVAADDNLSEPYSDEVPHPALLLDVNSWNDDLSITAMCEHHGGQDIFCSRENGSIVVFDVLKGEQIQQLVAPTAISVHLLSWSEAAESLVTADISSRFTVRKVHCASDGRWHVQDTPLHRRAERAIRQLLFNPSGALVLVSTDSGDEVWGVDGILKGSKNRIEIKPWRWVNYPASEKHLLLIEGGIAHIFEWDSLKRISRPEGIMLSAPGSSEISLDHAVSSKSGGNLCIRFLEHPRTNLAELQVYLTASLNAGAESADPIARYQELTARIKKIVGVYKANVLFLDCNGWVCSLNIDSLSSEQSYSRHFFIPFSWHSVGDLLCEVTSTGSVALAHRHEVVVFHHGLDFFEEKVYFESQKDAKSKGEIVVAHKSSVGAVKFSRRRRPGGTRSIRSDPGPGGVGEAEEGSTASRALAQEGRR